MIQQIVTVLIGILGGVAVGVQSPIANAIGQRAGSFTSSLIIHVSGAIVSAIFLIARRGEQAQNLRGLPWWMFCAGGLGVLLYLTLNHTIPRLGALAAISLLIVGQLVTGVLIDHFGLLGVEQRSIDLQRIIAVLLLIAGSYLISR
jgi:bacterial/archaeal transporter family-2 protein